ncbi:MAG: GGDEF domain-containing protein [Terriglobia bacterium]
MIQFLLNSPNHSADIRGMNIYEMGPEIDQDERRPSTVVAPPKALNPSSLDRALWRASEGRGGPGAKAVSPSDELRREVRAIEGRNPNFWPMLAVAVLMLAAGFLSLLWPNIAPTSASWRLQGQYLPLLFFGFVAMVVLYNLHLLDQNRRVSRTREELVRQLIRSEAAEMLAVIDPLTELFNRRYFDRIILREIARAERKGTPLVFLLMAVDNLKLANTLYGHAVGDRLLIEVARLLENNLRPSDIPIRHTGDDFLVLLPETRLEDARIVADRLFQAVEGWNASNPGLNYRMSISCGLALYTEGSEVNAVLDDAERQLFQHRARKLTQG